MKRCFSLRELENLIHTLLVAKNRLILVLNLNLILNLILGLNGMWCLDGRDHIDFNVSHVPKMAAKVARSEVILLLIFTFILVQSWIKAQENALNAPQVLLPYTPTDAVPANYTLKAARGCFRW